MLACACPASAGAAPAARRTACDKRGTTVARSAKARIFEVDRSGNRTLFGCWRANGRLQALSKWFSCDCSVGDEPAPDAALHAGRFAEVTEHESCGPSPDPGCGASATSVRDLRTRREAAAAGDVTDVVAVPATAGRSPTAASCSVRAGQETVLDPGPGVEAGSLAAAGARLYWMRGGEPRSALLG